MKMNNIDGMKLQLPKTGLKTLKIMKAHPLAIIPTRAHPSDAGLDLYATEYHKIEEKTLIGTGLAVDIPEGYEGTVRPKSGLTSKTNIRVQLGTIDSGYKGEIKVMVDNFDPYEFAYVEPGDKIAQLVISPIETPAVEVVEAFESESARGSNGFGSTGR